jgi:hypothetical protein
MVRRHRILVFAVTLPVVMWSCVPATAADLGGACCSDLEERIAELEATAVRKGNRKASLEISGWVNTAVLAFDDGQERNAYVVDNAQDRSRVRFKGSARIDADWSAGFLLEMGLRTARSDRVSADIDDTNDGLDLRHASWNVTSKRLGRVTVGQTSQVSDAVTQINLAGLNHVARSQVFDTVGGFAIRQGTVATGVRWRDLAIRENPGEGNRQNLIRYETPTIGGITVSASWGEDDAWDAGLRYAADAGGFKFAAGIGFAQWSESDGGGTTCLDRGGAASGGTRTRCQTLGLSVSTLHEPSGLFATFAYGFLTDDVRKTAAATFTAAAVDDRDSFLWVQAGLQQPLFAVGKSKVYGEYYRGDFGTPTRGIGGGFAGRQIGGVDIASSDVEMWGFGFNQSFDKAALDLYVGYRSYTADIMLETGAKASGLDNAQTLIMGGIVRF